MLNLSIYPRGVVRNSRGILHSAFVLSALLMLCFMSGCQKIAETTTATRQGESAEQIVARMIERYAACESYQDQATLRLSYRLQQQPHQETHPYETSWSRNASFRTRWFKSRVSGQGDELACRVIDIPTMNMGGQVVFQQAGKVGTFDAIFEDALAMHFVCGTDDLPWAPDVQENPNDQIPAIWSLLTNEHKPLWLRSNNGMKRLAEGDVNGHACQRIEVDTLLGSYVAWIDSKSALLRRLEIPQGVMARELNYTEDVQDIEIVVEFGEVILNGDPVRVADAMQPGPEELATRYFIKLPEKFPSDLIGKRIRDFDLTALRGPDLSRADLKDRVTVFVWFNGQNGMAACQDFNKVADHFSQFEEVACFGVCVDPATMANNQQVADLIRKWNLKFPVTRDLKSSGETVFDIRLLPTVVVIGSDLRMQYHEVADDDQRPGDSQQPQSMVDNTIAAVERLLEGTDIASEMREQYEDYVATYEKQLAAADPFRKFDPGAAMEVKLRRPSKPKRLKIERAWSSDELVSPGNIVVAGDGDRQRIFANDGWRTVVELDLQGNTVARHALDLPAGAAVAWTRACRDAVGEGEAREGEASRNWFAVGSMMDRRVFVFDDRWQLQFAYPPVEDDADESKTESVRPGSVGIADVRMIDADPSLDRGAAMLVAFNDRRAVHLVDMEGDLIAASDPLTGLSSIAVVRRPRSFEILIGTKSGKAVRFTDRLESIATRLPEDSENFLFIGGRGRDSQERPGCDSILSLGTHDANELNVTVLDEATRPVGNLQLISGVFREQVQFAAFADVLGDGQGQWFIARPDSSIHVISAGGRMIDTFQHGKPIRGIELETRADHGLLILSTSDGVEAFRIEHDGANTASNERRLK